MNGRDIFIAPLLAVVLKVGSWGKRETDDLFNTSLRSEFSINTILGFRGLGGGKSCMRGVER